MDFALGETFDYKFTTRAFATGIPTTLAGTPAVEIYEDNSTTQITAAETLTVDFDSVTGLNNLRVVATSGNGFEAGKSYAAVISTGTVGGVSVVGEVILNFTIERLNVAAISGDTTAADNLELDYDGTGLNKSNSTIGTVTNVSDKTGYSLAATGLDAIVATATGMVEIAKAVWDRVLTGGTHNVVNSAGRRLRFLQEAGTYAGAIWIDTVNGVAGTTDYENGTDTNPVSTIADANTLAASLGISRFKVAPGSSITFAASQQNQMFEGSSWTLALGGQNIDGTTIIGGTVSGIATNTSGRQYFYNCDMGAVTLPGDTHVIECDIEGTQTLGEAGDYYFDRCHSGVAGTTTPVLDFGAALNASNVNFRNYSGGIEIQNMGAGTGSYNMSLEGRGQLVINANCSATSTVAIRGLFTVTDNAGGAVTLSEDARIDVGQINAEMVDVITVDAIAELSQAQPSSTPTLATAVMLPYMAIRNKLDTTATAFEVHNDAGTVIAKKTLSDDGTTYSEAKMVSGP